MAFEKPEPLKTFIDGHGNVLTVKDLPESDEKKRWTVNRKLLVLRAVEAGAISLQDVLARYKLSDHEFNLWRSDLATFGTAGLRSTKARSMRKSMRNHA